VHATAILGTLHTVELYLLQYPTIRTVHKWGLGSIGCFVRTLLLDHYYQVHATPVATTWNDVRASWKVKGRTAVVPAIFDAETTMSEEIQEVYRQLPRIDNDLRDWALIITKG
jgi:hypothetical protein